MSKSERTMIIVIGSILAIVAVMGILVFAIVSTGDRPSEPYQDITSQTQDPWEDEPVGEEYLTEQHYSGEYEYEYESQTQYSTTSTTEYQTTTESYLETEPESIWYAYNTLSETEQQVYLEICQAVENHEPVLDVKKYSIYRDSMEKLTDIFLVDQAGYFWLSGTWSYKYGKTSGKVSSVEFTYCYSESEAAAMQSQIDEVVDSICVGINPYMGQYEIAKHVFESLIELVDYDTLGLELYDKVEHAEDEPDDLRSIYGAFVNRKAVCAGYARATQYILQKYGIECAYISSIEGQDHAWNLVKLDGDYYYMDTTWGDSSNTDPSQNYPDRIDYSFLAMTTAELQSIDSHTPDDTVQLPVCTSERFNYYKNKGLYFDYADYDKLSSVIYDALSKNEQGIIIRCANEQLLNEFKNGLFEQERYWSIVNELCQSYGFTKPASTNYYTTENSHLLSLSFVY